MNSDTVGGLLEEDAVVADAQPQEAFELAGERLHATGSGVGIAVDGFENGHGDVLRDGADLGRDLRFKLNLLHGYSLE